MKEQNEMSKVSKLSFGDVSEAHTAHLKNAVVIMLAELKGREDLNKNSLEQIKRVYEELVSSYSKV